jgi:hypothetical protein
MKKNKVYIYGANSSATTLHGIKINRQNSRGS